MPKPGDRIRAIRGKRKWTQEQLAEAAGISKSFLSDIENDKRNISSSRRLGSLTPSGYHSTTFSGVSQGSEKDGDNRSEFHPNSRCLPSSWS